MNSDRPRDPNLIPITVSMEAVPAVASAQAAFPEASDFKQEGEPVPLRVFEREFAIGVQFTVAADAATGVHRVPLRVRPLPRRLSSHPNRRQNDLCAPLDGLELPLRRATLSRPSMCPPSTAPTSMAFASAPPMSPAPVHLV